MSSRPPIDYQKATNDIAGTLREAHLFTGAERQWRLQAAVCHMEALLLAVRHEVTQEQIRNGREKTTEPAPPVVAIEPHSCVDCSAREDGNSLSGLSLCIGCRRPADGELTNWTPRSTPGETR